MSFLSNLYKELQITLNGNKQKSQFSSQKQYKFLKALKLET